MEIRIREARPEDRAEVMALLSATGLAPLDETAQFGPQYAVAEDAGGRHCRRRGL